MGRRKKNERENIKVEREHEGMKRVEGEHKRIRIGKT